MTLSELKPLIFAACKKVIEERLLSAQAAMNEAQASANQEEKSSAGDKYETGRAMAQLERDKAATQVAEALKLREIFSRINPDKIFKTVEIGTLVQTDQAHYFLGVAAGKLTINGIECLTISTASPIGQMMMGKKPGDCITFNKQTFVIREVC
jgi:transcription elongation GreA/GreB family factor